MSTIADFIKDEKHLALELLDELGEMDPEYRARVADAVEDLGKLGEEAIQGIDVEIGLQASKARFTALFAAVTDEKASILKGYFATLALRIAKAAASMILAI